MVSTTIGIFDVEDALGRGEMATDGTMAMAVVVEQASQVRVPDAQARVHRDECAYSFDSPLCAAGMYVNLQTWIAVGSDYVQLDHRKTGCRIYLWIKHTRKPKQSDPESNPHATKDAENEPTRLALGGPGGFATKDDKWDVEKEHEVVILPEEWRMPYPCPNLPDQVANAVEAILAHDEALDEKEATTWQEEILPSKYAKDLVQLDNRKKISPDPSTWVCEESGSKENLWLNLSTGFVGSGRRNWDGSGGNGAAIRHFEQTGKKYPLAVKLGTITPRGADVFSYAEDENDMVIDPYLAEHLAHWGIDVMQMEKTEKTMTELQIELNKGFEFDKITEAGADLQPVTGAGYMGLRNLGNTCYMNSMLQLFFALPEVATRYLDMSDQIFAIAPEDPTADFATQMAKLGVALCSERYASINPELVFKNEALEPRMFKHLIGRNHAEFSSNRQQDVVEFYQYMLEVAELAESSGPSEQFLDAGIPKLQHLFTFLLEDRLEDRQSKKVNYTVRTDNVLSLCIPMKRATNLEDVERFQERENKRQRLKSENAEAYIGSEESTLKDSEEEAVVPNVPFAACIEQFSETESIEGFLSPVTRERGVAEKTVRFKSFPPYLVVQMRRYYIDQNWTPKKLDVVVDAPQELDLEHLRSIGLQPGEDLLPEEDAETSASGAAPQPDETIVAQLVSMGFSENGSKRAVLATGNNSVEASMEWVLAHMGDADFNDPVPISAGSRKPEADPESVSMLTSMGFTAEQASAALQASNQSLERAADWLFSHADDLASAVQAVQSKASEGSRPAGAVDPSLSDGVGRYQLIGFISHVGKDTGCGHYVCHIRKDDRWVIYNDEKVAFSAHPPFGLGYAYVYRRVDFAPRG